jgi:coenzyme PQQ synthesis protein D (PqqD)
MFTFADRVQVPPHVLVRFLDSEAVLLNLESERYFGLDETGARMWQVATAAPCLESAYQELLGEYDVAPSVLRENFGDLLGTLVEHGLLVMVAREKVETSTER